jgi:gamma-glutamyltranspeptidase/glutathione hydrolase
MRHRAAAALLAGVLVAAAWAADRPEGRGFATRSGTVARHGMVAAALALAVGVGVDVLKRGGSAVDAAIAVNAALALMEPVACGPGGDLFALVWDPTTGALHGLFGQRRRLTPTGSRRSPTARSRSTPPTRGPCPGAPTAGSSCTRRFAGCRSPTCSLR